MASCQTETVKEKNLLLIFLLHVDKKRKIDSAQRLKKLL